MPPLRPASYLRYRGYVCSSCVAKLQTQRKLPWLIRHAASKANQNGCTEQVPHKPQPPPQPLDDSLVVRHFVESSDGSLEKVDHELGEDDIKMLKSRIAALEANIRKLKSEDLTHQEESLFDQLLSTKDAQSGATSQQFSLGGDAHHNLGGAILGDILIPLEKYPEDRRKNIPKLNQTIQNFVRQRSNATHIKDLWKWYIHCRNNLSSAWEFVPSGTWTLLWEAFSQTGVENPNRMTHIRQLADDMNAAGLQLSKPQTLLYLESLFHSGKPKDAISQWESKQTALAYDVSTARKYWELGVKMLANDNQPERAQQAIEILVNGVGESNFRVLISIIRYWLDSPDPNAVQRAWAAYVRLKCLLASDMEMGDFDAVSGAFLAAQQTDLALAVFRDMMLSTDPEARDRDSVAVYKRALRLTGDLRSLKLAPQELSWRSHEAFTALPRDKRNKYFFGSWIKRLIGQREVDWAAQVAGLMYHRGILPDPRYMNGIIGAWLRSGLAANQRKAEDLAWKMIAARLDFVRTRDQFGIESPLRPLGTSEKKAFDRPSSFSQVSTLATIETFCILSSFYQRRRRGDRVQEMYAAIKAAKIKPNTSFLNDLILVMAAQNRRQWAWNVYNQLIHEDGVAPDHDTFTVLWQMMKEQVQGKPRLDFPSPRVLFAEMVRWPQARKQGTLSREAYELILECFGIAGDQIGLLIALRAMQHLFDLYPSEDTVTNRVLQLAKTGHRKVMRQLPRRQERAQDLQSRMSRITEAANGFKKRRMKTLLARGIEFENVDATTRSEEVIMILSDLLRFAARSKIVHPLDGGIAEGQSETTSVQELSQLAAEEMGVPQCAPVPSSASVE